MLKTQTRRSHKKSRRGCHNCKQKHLKCDEQGPPCVNCAIRKAECIYPTPPPPDNNNNNNDDDDGEAVNHDPASAGSSRGNDKDKAPEKKRKRNTTANASGSRQPRIANARARAAANYSSSSSSSSPFSPPSTNKITAHSALVLNSLPSSYHSPHIPPIPSCPGAPATTLNGPLPTRFLELELMHRWMTRTWTGLYGFPGNDRDMLHSVPQLAVRHPYLMNGLLALAAADTFSSFSPSSSSAAAKRNQYLTAALEYGNESSVQLRETMRIGGGGDEGGGGGGGGGGARGITKENLYALFNASMLITMTGYVIDRSSSRNNSTTTITTTTSETENNNNNNKRTIPPAIERTCTYFDLQYGAFLIVKHNVSWYLSYPGTAKEVIRYLHSEELKKSVLGKEVKRALRCLDLVAGSVRIPPFPSSSEIGRRPFYNEISMYRMAIVQTKLAFAVEGQGILKGMCLSLTTATGPGFTAAVRGGDPMALFIMVFFAVAFDKLGQEERIGWWVGKGTGRELVGEVEGLLRGTEVLLMEEGREALEWARREVGLVSNTTMTMTNPEGGGGSC